MQQKGSSKEYIANSDMSNIPPCVTDAGVVNLGRDALVVLIHTQGIGDNPSKSASTQKRAKVKGQA